MTDESLRRADELLSELIETVETARAVPMSVSCVVPRERLLDLLDELREVLPAEIAQARALVARRDEIARESHEQAAAQRDRAIAEADTVLADARHRAEAALEAAEDDAARIVAEARAEHTRLISATAVHQGAAQAATALRDDAEDYHRRVSVEAEEHDRRVRGEADAYAHDARTEAERYATKLTADAEDYAERTLDELAAVLHRSADTAEQGRASLAQRRATHWLSTPSSGAAPFPSSPGGRPGEDDSDGTAGDWSATLSA